MVVLKVDWMVIAKVEPKETKLAVSKVVKKALMTELLWVVGMVDSTEMTMAYRSADLKVSMTAV